MRNWWVPGLSLKQPELNIITSRMNWPPGAWYLNFSSLHWNRRHSARLVSSIRTLYYNTRCGVVWCGGRGMWLKTKDWMKTRREQLRRDSSSTSRSSSDRKINILTTNIAVDTLLHAYFIQSAFLCYVAFSSFFVLFLFCFYSAV